MTVIAVIGWEQLKPISFTKILFLLFTVLYLVSCISAPRSVVRPPETGYMIASWYGPKFHGRLTASGEKFNMHAMTCAHKEFAFGTRLRVTYLKSRRSVVVTVNDRGPFIRGRDLDLSYAAAREIDLIKEGVGKVKIQYLGRDTKYVKVVSPMPATALKGTFTIQAGSFKERSNAERLKKGLKIRYKDVYISTVHINNEKFYRVRVGSFNRRELAYSFAKTMAEEGYSIFITGKH